MKNVVFLTITLLLLNISNAQNWELQIFNTSNSPIASDEVISLALDETYTKGYEIYSCRSVFGY
jgi:hypothetical protein